VREIILGACLKAESIRGSRGKKSGKSEFAF